MIALLLGLMIADVPVEQEQVEAMDAEYLMMIFEDRIEDLETEAQSLFLMR